MCYFHKETNVTILKCHVPRERLDFFRCARDCWFILQCGVFGTSPAPHPGTTRRRIFKPALSASHLQFVLLPVVVIWLPSVELTLLDTLRDTYPRIHHLQSASKHTPRQYLLTSGHSLAFLPGNLPLLCCRAPSYFALCALPEF